MRSVIAALALLATLAAAAPASAGWRIDRAQQIAAIVWHNPCAGQVKFEWNVTAISDIAATAGADVAACTIKFAPRADQTIPWTFGEFCDIVLHEYGHLAGFRDPTNLSDPMHSSNPTSIMYRETRDIFYVNEGTGDTAGNDPRCAERGRPFLQAHGAISSPLRPSPQNPATADAATTTNP